MGHRSRLSAPESPYLAFIVGLHVATALALLVFFWRDWVRIVGGFVSSIRQRRMKTDGERLTWLIILATIPIGTAGLLLEHTFRTVLGRPIPAAAFLIANGLILLVGERLRRRTPVPVPVGVTDSAGLDRSDQPTAAGIHDAPAGSDDDLRSDQRIPRLPIARGVLVGASQTLALLPGISRTGSPWSPA